MAQEIPGNIDLYNRPKVPNPDGGTSTVYSASFRIDGKDVLLPLADEGRILTDDEAVAKYKRTGKHLGIFNSPAEATAYAQQLHNDYAAGKYETKMPDIGERRTFNGQLGEWDGKGWVAVSPDASMPRTPRTWTDTAVDTLPMVGGTLGGIVGGLGGTAFGMGVGGVPGAVGGAALGGAGGEAARQLVNRVRGVPGEGTMTEAATGIGTQGAIQGGAEVVGQGATRALGAGAKAVYRGYLKPSLAKNSIGKAGEIVQTAIDEALPVTEHGVQKARNVIGDLRRQVDNILATTPGDVDLHTVADRVRAFAKAKYFRPGTPSADYDAALAVADSIDKHASLTAAPTTVSLPAANQVKRGIDTAVGEASFGTERGATKTTQKFARRTMRQAIEAKAPEVGPINAREGRLLDAAKALARSVGREENKSPLIGVNTLVSGAVGGNEYRRTGNPYEAAASALAARMFLAPAVASRVALVASQLGKMSPEVPAVIARIAVQAVSETGNDEQQQVQ